jgi:hypothetical protein
MADAQPMKNENLHRRIHELEACVAELTEAQKELRDSETNLRAFLNAIPESALLIDQHGTILAMNPACARRINLRPDKAKGLNAFDQVDELGPVNTMRIPIDGGNFLAGQGALSVLYFAYMSESATQSCGKMAPSLKGWPLGGTMRRCASLIWNNQTALCAPCLAPPKGQRWASA